MNPSFDNPSPPVATPASLYDQWLERVAMTYESVAHCCLYRLRDRALAEQVGLKVIAGLLERPRVFRYFGLPFSGRVAHLAELGIVEARRGESSAPGGRWDALRVRLLAVPPDQQHVFVLACVEGYEDAELATALGCDLDTAEARRENALELMKELCKQSLASPGVGSTKEAHDVG